jgi:NAD+ kinase
MPSVERAAVVTHGRTRDVGGAVARVRAVADAAGVELLFDPEDAARYGIEPEGEGEPDIAVVLGGDGTMLRALARFLGTDVPVIGVNFGRVGFLTAIPADDLEPALGRVFRGQYRTISLPTLEALVDGQVQPAVNDVVLASASIGRVIELGYAIGGEDLGVEACDGLISATPQGSTAYNLSNGGPVLVWGLDAMVITFSAPHTLYARPLVVGPETNLVVWNRSPDVDAAVLVDGHRISTLPTGGEVTVHLGTARCQLALLPEQTFFTRYSQVFGSTGVSTGGNLGLPPVGPPSDT